MNENRLSISPTGTISLHLENKTTRHIGEIHGDSFHCERIPEKHFLKVNQSYGFNYHLMKTGSFRFVVVHLSTGELLETTREFLLAHGSFLQFSKQGFERQIFLRLRDFELERALVWERLQEQATERVSNRPRLDEFQEVLGYAA